ncbi:hypothetical protein [Armatimonas sp.]|uniref:hypothetical protein n=1 Tax=Armatimonas sp. TaxID=1872638 RepID=UPI0037507CE2
MKTNPWRGWAPLALLLLALMFAPSQASARTDFGVGDIVEFSGVGQDDFQSGKTFVGQVLTVQEGEPKYRVRILTLGQVATGGVHRDVYVYSPKVRAWSKPYTNEWNPALWMGTWNVGNVLARTIDNVRKQDNGFTTGERNQAMLTINGILVIRANGTFAWRVSSTDLVQGQWIKSDDPQYILVLQKAKYGNDYVVYPNGKNEKGELTIGLQSTIGASWHNGPRVGSAPTTIAKTTPKPNKTATVKPAKPTVAPSRQAPDQAVPPTFAAGATVEVFRGTYWQKATITTVEGKKYNVHYGDRFTADEAVEALSLRAENSGPTGPVRVGDKIEVIHKFVNGKVAIFPAVVLGIERGGVLIRCTASPELAHLDHYATNSDDRMNSSIVRFLGR